MPRKTKQQEIDALFEDFKNWFSDKYIAWLKTKLNTIEESVRSLYDSTYDNDVKIKRITELKNKFFSEKVQFVQLNLHEYYNVVFDDYNTKKISKRLMLLRCKEIARCIEMIDEYENIT